MEERKEEDHILFTFANNFSLIFVPISLIFLFIFLDTLIFVHMSLIVVQISLIFVHSSLIFISFIVVSSRLQSRPRLSYMSA